MEEKKETPRRQVDETITIKKETLWKYSTFVLLAIVIVGAFVMFNGKAPTGAVVAGQPTPSAAAPTPAAQVEFDVSKAENVKGDSSAKVTVVEWSDFECPFCARFYSDAYKQIQTEYVDTGKIQFAYEHFPLNFHPQAQKAAEASECAAEQGKFWEMHDMLFERGVQGGVTSFKTFAVELGLNANEFNDCLDSGSTAAKVQADMAEGTAIGVRGTPGFAIVAADGTTSIVSGAHPFSVFKQAIDAALA